MSNKRYVAFGIDLGEPLDLSVLTDALPRGTRPDATQDRQPASQARSDQSNQDPER